MEFLVNALLIIHVSAGFMSIVLFWLPMCSKKGGKLHKSSGRWYVNAMWVVTTSAALLCIKNVIVGNLSSAIFLGFLAVITSGPLWYGIAILNHKKGRSDAYKKKFLIYHLIVFGFAIFMIGFGLYKMNHGGEPILMFIFGGLGLTSFPDIIRGFKKTENKHNWIQEHAIAMITTGIAAYTAFFVFGGNRMFGGFLSGYWTIVPWVAPGMLGTLGNVYYSRKYATKK